MSSPAAAKRTYVTAWSGLWHLVGTEGPRVAAEAAWHPGHRCASVADLADEIRERIAETRQKAGAA